MSKSSGSFRVLVVLVALFAISALLVNTYALDLSGPWGSSQNGLEMSSTSLQPSMVTIGTCDTAGPIEVESSGGTTTPTAYANLKAAFDAILAGTHTGSINIEVCGNTTEAATAAMNASGTGTASYTDITIRPVGGARIIEGTIVGAIIKLNGADNVTIDGRQGGIGSARDLTVRNTNTSAATAAIWLASVAAGNGASNNTIRNLEIAGGTDSSSTSTSASFGIIMCGTTISATANGDDNDNNQFVFNRVIKARYGIVTRGTTTNLNISPVVADNIVGPTAFGTDQIGKVGILMQADTGALVTRNTVQFVGCLDPQACTGADRMGIAIGNESWSTAPGTITSNTYTVTRNVVHDIVEELTFSSIGIDLATTGGGAATNNLVANNFVYNVRANGTSGDQAVGIGIAGGLGDKVVFNSVSMTGDVDPGVSAASTNFGSGIRVGNASGSTHGNLTLSSNSVYMDLSSSSTAANRYYAISGPVGTYNWGTGGENFNNYYINPINTQSQTGGLGTTSGNALTTQFATLANWQTAYTTPAAQDANSIQADPLHVSTTADLHIAAGSPNVNAGNAVSGVTRDIDNEIRVAVFDIGADEPGGIAPPANDIEATSILVPSNGSVFPTGSTTTPQARFTNIGSATVTGRQVTFTITGPGGYNYSNNQTIASVDPDQAVTITFSATPAFAMAGSYTMTASTAADSNTSNDSLGGSFNAVAPFNGSYNVGTSETFTSLTNPGGIFAAINAAGATGNITINITSDLTGETGAVTLNEITGGFTTLIKPSGAARTISGNSGAVGLVGFNGADGVTVDGSLSGGTDRSLTIAPTNATNTGGGMYFASGATGSQNNVVKNVNVFGNGSITGVLLGITFGGNAFGGLGVDNDNNRIENCDVRGAYYGIASLGASALNKDAGLVVTRNVMPATGASGIGRVGIYVIFADGAQITQNNISSVSNPGSVDTIGIAAGSQAISSTPLTTGGISNSTIARNYVGVVSNIATFSAAGIVVASDTTGTNNVVNNMVTGVIGNANAGDILAGIYVNGLAGSTQNVYHNSVSMTGDRLPVTANMLPSYALVVATDQPTNVVNNAFSNSQTHTGSTGGGGESYAIGFDGPAANVNLLSNYNDLLVSGPIGVVGITGDLTTAAQTTTAGTGTNQATLAAWQAATTEDANSISVDPLFTSLTDLHIPVGSPLVNVGTDVGVTVDYDGQTRGAMRDIGADEYVPPPSADLSITKTDGVTTATPGGSVTYTITASNAGPDAVTGATVADTFPASLTATWTCVGAGGGTCTASGSGNINDTVNLPVGGSVTYTASASVNASATGTLSNTATVSSSTPDPNPPNNSATDVDTLVPSADLVITKTDGVTTATPGGSVTYTITAANAGPSNTTGTVADTFPAILTGNWTCAGNNGGTCTAAGSGNINDAVNLPAGGSVTYVVSASINASATGSLSNTATVNGAATDPVPGNNSATDVDTLSPSADLSITKTDGVTTVTAGGTTTYTITAANAGPSNAPGTLVADTFPAAITSVNWTCVGAGGGTCTASGSGNISDTVNLPAGGSVTYTAVSNISIAASGSLVNTATVANAIDPVPGNNSATDTDTITGGSTGPVTVTATTGTTGPTDYPTVKDAFDAVNAGTHTGVVTVSIVSNTTETGPAILNGSGAGSASYTALTIRPTSDNVTIAGPTVTGRGLIELNGADNVIIDGDNAGTAGTNRNLTIQNTAANTVTFTSVIRVALNITTVNSADNNIFRNLNIVGSSTGRNIVAATSTTASENTTFGIFVGPNASDATTAPTAITSVVTGVAAGATAANLIVDNNNVVTAARAVSINGSAATVSTGLQVKNNQIGNPTAGNADQVTAIGITVNGATSPVISGNLVWVEGYVRSSAATHAINVGVNSVNTTGAVIEKNRVNRVKQNDLQSWSAFGVNLGGGNNHVVRNNFVSGVINDQTGGTGAFGTTFGAYGIRVGSGTGHQVYHNSVNLYGAMGGVTSTNLTAAFMVVATTQTGVDARNNIFVNTITGGNPTGTRNVAIYVPTAGTSAMNLTLNNNGYFVGADAMNRMAQRGTTFGTGEYALADFDPADTANVLNFRNYSNTLSAAGTNDNAGKKVDPQFTSNVDLHILATSLMESGGANVGVVDDIDGDSRTAVPDIGADEISVAGPGVVQFSSTAFSANEGATATINVIRSAGVDGTVGITATVTDGTATGGAACTAGVDYINPGPQVLTYLNGEALKSFGIVTCTDALLKGNQTVTLTLSNPTGGTSIGANNPATLTIVDVPPPFSGTINVGTGETFTSLTNAGGIFEALNGAGLSANLTVNLTSDLTAETGAVFLNQLSEFGAGGYTLTIKPSGAARVISGTAPINRGLINLNGSDRVIIDGSLSGGTDRSLTITNNQTGTSTVIWIRSASAANGSNNNTIKNSIINGAVGAIASTTAGILTGSGVTIGGDAEAANSNNTIQNNWIYRVQNSAYLRGGLAPANFDQNWVVTGNEFGSTASTADKNIFRGMLIGNSQNFAVTSNVIHGVQSSGTTTASMSGIQIGLLVNGGTVTKNVISDIKNISATGTGANAVSFISTSTASNVTVANNFISDVAAAGSATLASNGFGINVASGAGYKIYYNSVNLNTNQASGTTAAMLVQAAVVTAGGLDIQDNIFANTQTAGATRYAFYSGAAATVYTPINYNDYFSTGSVGFLGAARATLGEWQTATGQDLNSAAVDPLFVSATDLHLQAASPVTNLGTPIAAIADDIDGNTRSAITPEIGADELSLVAVPGSLQFSSATYSVGEAGPTATITVTRTGGSDGIVGASYATVAGGTATGGGVCGGAVDYVPTSGTVTFGDGVTTPQTFTISICDDVAVEGAETVNIALTTPAGGATIGSPSTAVLTINDNDAAGGSYSINDVRVVEGNSGPANAVFTVTYTAGGASAVNFGTANRTATAGTDYTTNSGTLNFPASGSTQTQTVTVVVAGDTVKEANETFFVNLSGATGGAAISDNQGVGVIVDEDRAYFSDFDRDLKADFSVARGSENRWYVLPSSTGVPSVVTFGTVGDRPTPGDYDGDGKTDMAFYRPSTSAWHILNSATSTTSVFTVGAVGDKPVQGDYNGDGRTDPATFRPTGGLWSVFFISTGTSTFQSFGLSTDRPVQGDYDGDAKTDLAVYRDGTWYVLFSSNSSVATINWGNSTDKPVTGDFDGDGQFDLAIYRNGQWWVLNSLTGNSSVISWGLATDIAVPADYDGDGTTDVAIFRPSDGDWYVLRSSTLTIQGLHWGLNGDFPIPAGHLPQ